MKLKLTWLLTLFMAFVMQFSFAQEKTVTGTVTTADDGLPLPGASVVVKGTSRGQQTDFDGKYAIQVSQGDVLVVSYVGMKTAQVTIGAGSTYDVALELDNALDEVIVTAYGSQKKESIAGSIGEIKSEEIAEITAGNVLQGTVGKVAGVQVFNNSGMPGDGPTIRMRGIGSINASSAPLYVVDGVPFSGDVASINSQDIESMTFLKDASAAALYGNRGANGVIIITTKKGKFQKVSITLDTKAGFSSRGVKEYDIMDSSKEYYERYYQSLKNSLMFGSANLSEADASVAAANGIIDGEDGLAYNNYGVPNDQLIDPATGRLNPNANMLYSGGDWDDYLFGSGFFSSTYVSVSGGNEKTSQFFSLGYDKNEGYVVNSGLEKITSRLKVDSQITDRLKVGGNLNYSHLTQDYLDGYTGGSTYSSPFFWTRTVAPIYPVLLYDNDGNPVYNTRGTHIFDDGTGNGGQPNVPVRPFGALQHPFATATNDIKEYLTDNLYASAFAELKLLEGLKFTYVVTGDLFSRGDRSMDTPLYGDAVNTGGRVGYSSARTMAFTQQQLLNYNKSFGNHNFDFLLGHETLDRRTDVVSAGRSKMLFPTGYVDQAAVIQYANGYGTSYALEGFFARMNYDFSNKYFLNASIRRDGSSRFHPDNRWGTFYGLGAAWSVSSESFMENVTFIDNLRLKASFGEQGNDNLGIELPYLDQYSVTATTDASIDVPSFNLVALGNKEITWETNTNFNVGFDVSMFNNRVSLEAEYFERKVTDMLYQKPLPVSSGFSTQPENIGDMQNTGFEATLGIDIVRSEDFNLNFNANATHYKNKITKLPFNGFENNQIIAGAYIRQEGGGIYDYYMREFAGVNPNNGAATWYMDDPNNEGQKIITEDYSEATRYDIGKSALPDVYGGFSFDINYKAFDLGIQFAYQLGGYSYDGVYMSLLAADRGENYHRDANVSWTPANTTAKLPRIDVGDPKDFYSTSTLGLTKSDYLSIQNLSLGYTFKPDVVETIGLSSLRVYSLVDNVNIWSKRQGYDPRSGGVTGASSNNYSLLRTVSFGVNVKF